MFLKTENPSEPYLLLIHFGYLDVILSFNDDKYRPSHKPNEETTYIYVELDHRLHIV